MTQLADFILHLSWGCRGAVSQIWSHLKAWLMLGNPLPRWVKSDGCCQKLPCLSMWVFLHSATYMFLQHGNCLPLEQVILERDRSQETKVLSEAESWNGYTINSTVFSSLLRVNKTSAYPEGQEQDFTSWRKEYQRVCRYFSIMPWVT